MDILDSLGCNGILAIYCQSKSLHNLAAGAVCGGGFADCLMMEIDKKLNKNICIF